MNFHKGGNTVVGKSLKSIRCDTVSSHWAVVWNVQKTYFKSEITLWSATYEAILLFPYLGNHLRVLCIIHQLCIYQTQINYLQSLFLCSRICQSKSQHNTDLYTVLNLCGFGCSLCPKVSTKVIMKATRNKFLISFYIYTFWRWLSPAGSSLSS